MITLLRPRRRARTAPPTPAADPKACTHPADALASRPASTLSRAVVQICGACQQQWAIRP